MRLSFEQCGEMNVDGCDVVNMIASLIDQVSGGAVQNDRGLMKLTWSKLI